MKYLKIFSSIILSIVMLTAVFFSMRGFMHGLIAITWLRCYYIHSVIILIGFIFLLIYVGKTKNIYSLCASLFLTTTIVIIIFNLSFPVMLEILTDISIKTGYILTFISNLIFLIAFITLFFFFRDKSKKYIKNNETTIPNSRK